MSDKISILGVGMTNDTMQGCAERILQMMRGDRFHYVCTPNSEILHRAHHNAEFKQILNQSDLNAPDGIGVVYAAKILGTPLQERVAGLDLLCKVLGQFAGSVYLFGGKPGIAEKAAEHLIKTYPAISIVGTNDGYFDSEKEKQIVDDINRKQPDLLLVCVGAPKQELWMYQNKDILKAKVAMGLGGTLDVFAGTEARAPQFYIDHGLEWFYRLIHQPQRFFRMLALPAFMIEVLWDKFFGRKQP